MLIKILLGALVAGTTLFLWSGLTQKLPWGPPTARTVVATKADKQDQFQGVNAEYAEPGQYTTSEYDKTFVGKVNTLTTDQTFSWIVTKPVAYYRPGAYLLKEAATQFLVGLLIAVLVVRLGPASTVGHVTTVAIAALAAGIASYGQLFNWWGLTTAYAVGALINIVVGWSLAAFLVARFVVN